MKKMLTYLAVTVNALLAALIYHLFVYPNHFAPAGIGGICTMIQHIFDINVGYLNLLINLPLAVCVYFLVSKSAALRGMVFVTANSLFLILFSYVDLSPFIYHTENGSSTIMGPLVGGLAMGYLCALLVRIGTHQGGTYFIGSLIRKFRPDCNVFWMIFGLNTCVAGVSYFVYGMHIEPVLLCIVYCFAASMVNDRIAKGDRSAVRFEIITEHEEALSKEIINRIHHSATLMPGKGIYKGKENSVLICIVNHTQAAQLAAIIRSYPNTFASISQVTEVVGNFKRLDNQGNAQKHFLDHGDNQVV